MYYSTALSEEEIEILEKTNFNKDEYGYITALSKLAYEKGFGKRDLEYFCNEFKSYSTLKEIAEGLANQVIVSGKVSIKTNDPIKIISCFELLDEDYDGEDLSNDVKFVTVLKMGTVNKIITNLDYDQLDRADILYLK